MYSLPLSLSFFLLHASTYIDNLWGYKRDLTYSQDVLSLVMEEVVSWFVILALIHPSIREHL
jgi:hypothetical protein